MLSNYTKFFVSSTEDIDKNKNYEHVFLVLLFVSAIAIRYVCLPNYQVIAADGTSYIDIARRILNGEGMRSALHYPPFYPLLIAIFSFIFSDYETAGLAVSSIMGSLVIIPVYLIGREFYGKTVGALSSILAMVWPDFVFLSNTVLSQTTYITLLMFGIYFIWSAYREQTSIYATFASIFFACAYLTRPEALISLFGVTFFLTVSTLYAGDSWKKLKPIMICCIVFFVLIFPYINLVHEITGKWSFTGKSPVTLTDCISGYLNKFDLNRDPMFTKVGYLDLITLYPGYIPWNIVKNSREFIAFISPFFIISAFLGFLAVPWRNKKVIESAFLLGTFVPMIAIWILFFVSSAYLSPYIPILIIWSVYGGVTLERKVTEKFGSAGDSPYIRMSWLCPVMVVTIICLSAHMVYDQIPSKQLPYHHSMDGARYDHKLIGKMLKQHLPAGSKIMTRSGRIAFYSGLPSTTIPQAGLNEIMLSAINEKVNYLVVEGALFYLRPQLGFLLQPMISGPEKALKVYANGEMQILPGLSLKLYYSDPSSQGVVVYEITNSTKKLEKP